MRTAVVFAKIAPCVVSNYLGELDNYKAIAVCDGDGAQSHILAHCVRTQKQSS